MTTTHPTGSSHATHPDLASRDEYPALGRPRTPVTRTGIVMGPPPRVHLRPRPAAVVREAAPVVPLAAPAPEAGISFLPPVAPLGPALGEQVVERVADSRPEPAQARPAPAEVWLDSPEGRREVIAQTKLLVRRRRRRRRLLLAAAAVITICGLVAGIWRYVGTASASTPPSRDWTPDVATSNASKPAAGQVPTLLSANPIYDKTLTGTCRAPGKNDTADAVQATISAYLDCMNDAWGPIITSSGFTFTKASIKFIATDTNTKCGTYRNAADSVAYCPVEMTLYVPKAALTTAAGQRLYVAGLVTHEYAHHVQNLTQILETAGKQGWSSDEYSRRIQLQSQCLSYAVLVRVIGFNTPEDRTTLRRALSLVQSDTRRGTAASQQFWGERGIGATFAGDCDTFSAPATQVA